MVRDFKSSPFYSVPGKRADLGGDNVSAPPSLTPITLTGLCVLRLRLCMFLGLIESDDFEAFKGRLHKSYSSASSDPEPQNARQITGWNFAHCNQEKLTELHMPIEYFHRWVNVAYDVSLTGTRFLYSV